MAGFSHYLDPNIPIEDRLKQAFDELHIENIKRERITNFLEPLKNKDLPNYKHSIRVGLLNRQITHFMHLNEKAGLYSGLLHDIGKAQIDKELLQKNDWTPSDAKKMQPHVLIGYNLIINSKFFKFSAEIMKWHHKFQTHGYPDPLPASSHPYNLGTETMIPFYGRLLALADCYDAAHRHNLGILTGEQIKKEMLESNPDQEKLIIELYEADIFTTRIISCD